MPLSYRLLISIIAGCTLGIFVPLQSLPFSGFWGLGASFSLVMWRYLAFPFLFFGLIMAVAQLKREKRLLLMLSINSGLIVFCSFVMAVLGTLLAIILPIKRIPAQFEKIAAETPVHLQGIFDSLFPANAFNIFSLNSLLPMAILAIIIGINLDFDREVAEPSYNLADSLSRIFYHIFEFTIQFSWLPMFFLSVHTSMSLKAQDLVYYQSFFWTMTISLIVCVIVLVVLLSYFLTTYKNPASWMRRNFSYILISLFSPNIQLNACTSSYMSHTVERIKRDLGGLTSPLFALFSRIGSVFVCSMAMITIVRSYSSLSLNFGQIFMIFVYAFLASFLVSHRPEGALFVMLPLACMFYGRPLTSGSHILEPIMLHITLVASFVDSMMIGFAHYFISNLKSMEKKSPLQKKKQ
ncbi:MAG: cation:dicarboxylate symporter family transporter [Spirochaetia bacterium]